VRRPGARARRPHGHANGDAILKSVAAILSANGRKTDVVARLGGDEFGVVLPEVSEQQAMSVAAKLQARVGTSGSGPRITSSIGVVHYDGTQELTAEQVLVCADIAMYEVKDRGATRSAC
jgi:diguanylate cyclase (GGDEF)-like protein